MIRNADLYDLINISLRSSELSSESVEQFIFKALEKKSNETHSNSKVNDENRDLTSQKYGDNTLQALNQNELIFTPPSKLTQKLSGCSQSPTKRLYTNDENTLKQAYED